MGYEKNMVLIFDEYDSGQPDVMFVIQQLLEKNGKLFIPDRNELLTPHEDFRMFATANTVGLGDFSHMYRGSQVLNQAQLDRWNISVTLNYLSIEQEKQIVKARVPYMTENASRLKLLDKMVQLANLVRNGNKSGDITNLMSPRTVITWAENYQIFQDEVLSFKLSFLNKCLPEEKLFIAEYYQRCFGTELEFDDVLPE